VEAADTATAPAASLGRLEHGLSCNTRDACALRTMGVRRATGVRETDVGAVEEGNWMTVAGTGVVGGTAGGANSESAIKGREAPMDTPLTGGRPAPFFPLNPCRLPDSSRQSPGEGCECVRSPSAKRSPVACLHSPCLR
jgi:hypothetical protein